MNYSEVKQLLDAGFTADEIRQMLTPAPAPEEQQPEQTPAAPAPAPEEQQPEQTPAAPAAAPELDERLTGLNNTINNLIKTIQASNLQNNFRDSNPEVNLEKEVDDIMKSIIRQPKEEKQNER